jgi:hypothetical protein
MEQAYNNTLTAGPIGVIVVLAIALLALVVLTGLIIKYVVKPVLDQARDLYRDFKAQRAEEQKLYAQNVSALQAATITLDSMNKGLSSGFALQPALVASEVKPLLTAVQAAVNDEINKHGAALHTDHVGIAQDVQVVRDTVDETAKKIAKMSASQTDIFKKIEQLPTTETINAEFLKVIQQLSAMESTLPAATALAVSESITAIKQTVLDIYGHVTKPLPPLPPEPDPLSLSNLPKGEPVSVTPAAMPTEGH